MYPLMVGFTDVHVTKELPEALTENPVPWLSVAEQSVKVVPDP
jgi:hypothetical protein